MDALPLNAHRSKAILAMIALSISAGNAAAQVGQRGQVELGGFAAYTRYDPTNLGFDKEFGGGGRLAFFLNRHLSIEAAGDFTETTEGALAASRLNVTRLSGTALYHLWLGGTALYIGGGYERTYYRGAREANESGGVAVIGERLPLGGRAAFRIEGRASYYPSSEILGSSQSAFNLSAAAGISIFAFGGPPRDGDGDGVVDRRDDCADTPLGATVDRIGCPADGDEDGYLDGLDQCTATPRGATVDARGCPSDADADSVLDGIDVCPDTPSGASVDANGCPSDTDGDAVLDGLDRCPDTPKGATVDQSGCPTDQDGDGVFDGSDQCPDTPAGVEVDEQGCTVDVDDDGDGVRNRLDRCPGTRPGRQVDALGCAVLFVVAEGRARPLVLKGVNFASGRSGLTRESFAVLDEVVASLIANEHVRIEIAGYTDATGSRRRNMALSLGRAMAVRAYLAQKGVAPDRMTARGYGPDQPVTTNRTRAGRAQNRRVELHLIEGQNQ